MNAPFWRCTIISLLLLALPAQWLAAAATLPCAGNPVVVVHAAPEATSEPDALEAAHHHIHDAGHGHGLLAHAHTGASASAEPHTGHVGAQAHTEAKCDSAGHCCLSNALVSTPTMPDFAQRSAWADFVTLSQHHRSPVLGGPERPPRSHTASLSA